MPFHALGLSLAVLFAIPAVARAEEPCSQKTYGAVQAEMTSRLRSAGYSKEQSAFLISGARRHLSMLREGNLKGSARECGIDSAKAHVLGCLAHQLFPLKQAAPALDETKSSTFWGRSRLSVRELLFIGSFHACLAAAKQAMFRP